MVVKEGRFGPYVTDGEAKASLRKGDTPEGLDDERASELLAGPTAAVDYPAGPVPGLGTRRSRLARSLAGVEAHETRLRRALEAGLADLGAEVYSRAGRRTSTILFDLPGVRASHVAVELARAGVNAPAGSFYALETSRHLGLGDTGAVRVGITAYNTSGDVDRLLSALSDLTRS